jgi:hypothetical protein
MKNKTKNVHSEQQSPGSLCGDAAGAEYKKYAVSL